MDAGPDLTTVAALLAAPARAAMLWALAGGEALPASELAHRAGVAPQTASHHLARMVEAGLLAMEPCLRYRYYRLASPTVAHLVEDLMALSGPPALQDRPDRKVVDRVRAARSCYDHLAGRLGVALADAMVRNGWLSLQGRDYAVTAAGGNALATMGIDVGALQRQRRLFARRCIDWSERRPHVGGALGAALLGHFQTLDWLRKGRDPRILHVTAAGRRGLWDAFGIDGDV